MGADSTIIFYGVRYPLDEDEIESAESEDHPYMLSAQRIGLQTYWGRESELEPCFLMIGQQLAWLGAEHQSQAAIDHAELIKVMEDVQAKLSRMGAREATKLHVQYEYDE